MEHKAAGSSDMRTALIFLLIGAFTLSACGSWRDSRVNPTNWFGNSRSAPSSEAAAAAASAAVPNEASGTAASTNPLIPTGRRSIFARPDDYPGVPISAVTELRIEQTPSGAIIYATGVANRQGAYNAFLRPLTEEEAPEDGVLIYAFDVVYPEDPTRVGSERTRTVQVARTLSRQQLEGVRLIRVEGVQNARESRRN